MDINNTSHEQTIIADYGTWLSPISAEKIADGTKVILNLLVDGEMTYWCEMRPANKGRYTIVRRDREGTLYDVTPPNFNARTFVHEYGGGAFTVDRGVVYVSNAQDHAIYSIHPGMAPKRLTEGQVKVAQDGNAVWSGVRFADIHPCPQGLIAVGEEHGVGQCVENFLALIDTITGSYKKLVTGHDFYSSPTLSSDGKNIAWICWNHPEMPWTHTELWFGELTDQGIIKNKQHLPSSAPESFFQPQWSKEGILYFVTDRDRGWWNIHRYVDGKVENVCPIEAEVGEPLWVFDRSTYAFLGDHIIFSYNLNGRWQLAILNPKTKEWSSLDSDRDSQTIQHLRAGPGFVQFLEGSATQNEALMQLDDLPGYPVKILERNSTFLDQENISKPQHVAFSSGPRTAYGFYYPPKNKNYSAPVGQKPPLVVMIHGGPTAQAKGNFQLKQQYWTTRGFAVLDVNYGGSTGYGREYRKLLDLSWGIVDIEDCENGALFLVRQGLVDPNKLVIRGGSAGGYTTLAALAFRKTFCAGANYFGVADITALANDTHKFEKLYMEQLVGKYPEEKAIWESRSPINSVDTINVPLIIFQGEDDQIVPKNQSVMIYEALQKRGIRSELHIYPGEEHGFRQSHNIIHSLNREVEFYLEQFKQNNT